jgi:hypothetical protein
MKSRFLRLVLLGACALLCAGMAYAQSGATAPESASACDRPCLQGFVDHYLTALLAHDPSPLPLAAHVKYTENTAEMPLGDGLWVGASEAPSAFKIYALDPVTGQAGFYGVMKEFDKPVIFALRLKVESGKITEIEHIVARDLRPSGMPNLVTPRPGLLETVPPAERVPREQMVRIANSYFDAIEQSNGDVAPFADDCERHENGMQTTSNKRPPQPGPLDSLAANPAFAKIAMMGCRDSLNTNILSYITRIRPRRPLIVDEEKGLVYTFPMFRHRGNVRVIKLKNVPGVESVPMPFGPIDLEAGEIFKIRGGKIHEIEAMGFLLPYNSRTGWEDADAVQQVTK